jgi:mono/diheme cytochrome c family protein/plastocyanin
VNRSEFIARSLVLGAALAAIAVPLAAWWRVPLVHASMPEAGGWNPAVMRATVGEPLHLRLTSDDVMHGFAVGHLDAPAVDVLPGKVSEVTLVFNEPGTYTYYCTRWCGLNHWRMRGTIEVDGGQPGGASINTPLYVSLGIDLDADRSAEVLPAAKPVAEAATLTPEPAPERYRSVEYYRSHSPASAWLDLRAQPVLQDLDDQEVWDLTARIWRSNTSPAILAEGKDLYAQNCAACHGEQGAGDGVFADDLAASSARSAAGSADPADGMIQKPASLVDPSRMLAASPALLHGKILRGGMGTGMPSWGPLFTESQVWSLVAHLYSLQFDYR